VSFVALLDANVLYPPYLRDLLLRFAQAGVFEPRWSAEILDEVARNIKKGRGEAEQQKVERMLSLMRRHFEDAEVTGYEALTPAMTNDEKDRHVLAAAIVGGSDVIVTSNLKHFPRAALEPYDMDVQGPDEFLCHQWEQADPERIVYILRRWTDQLRRHPATLEEILEERLFTTVPNFSSAVLQHTRRFSGPR
jgi:predicted nucleic acid-binding protein